MLIVYVNQVDPPPWFRMTFGERQALYRHTLSLHEYEEQLLFGVGSLLEQPADELKRQGALYLFTQKTSVLRNFTSSDQS
ncbi:MAG: hypothetical protein O6945_15855 [Gammaproteobacteria bacterium]|nr:hypothetical protein [Gammaproteobacteria bacterium]